MTNLSQPPVLRGDVPLVKKDGTPTPQLLRFLRDLHIMTWPNLTPPPVSGGPKAGQIRSGAVISGRSEGVGTTVGQIDATGKLQNGGVGFSTDPITDGAGSPLTGGKRGFVALDANNRLTNSFRNNALNASGTPTTSSILSNDGVSTAIPIVSSQQQFGAGVVSYNSGSVDPGSFGTWFVFADDPTFSGGAVVYQFSASAPTQTAADGRVNFGKITTAMGVAHTGGGFSGGDTPGGSGGRGYNPG